MTFPRGLSPNPDRIEPLAKISTCAWIIHFRSWLFYSTEGSEA